MTDVATTPDETVEAQVTVRRRGGLPWALAIVAILLAMFTTFLWFDLDRGSDAELAVATRAGEVITLLTNWEADELDAVREEVRPLGTERFQEEADLLFEGLTAELEQARAVSTGEVLDLAVELRSDDAAFALAVVRQEVTSLGSSTPDVDCYGARAEYVRSGGAWLIDGLELYGPNDCPTGDAP